MFVIFYNFLLTYQLLDRFRTMKQYKCKINLSRNRAGDGEVYIDVHFRRRVLEVDAGQVFVVRLAQVKRELVVDRQLV